MGSRGQRLRGSHDLILMTSRRYRSYRGGDRVEGGWVTGPKSCCLTGAEPGDLAETGGSELETSQ